MICDSWKTLLLVTVISIESLKINKWGVEMLRSGNKETLALDLTKTALTELGGFFVPFPE